MLTRSLLEEILLKMCIMAINVTKLNDFLDYNAPAHGFSNILTGGPHKLAQFSTMSFILKE
jgi:hypothetical protein